VVSTKGSVLAERRARWNDPAALAVVDEGRRSRPWAARRGSLHGPVSVSRGLFSGLSGRSEPIDRYCDGDEAHGGQHESYGDWHPTSLPVTLRGGTARPYWFGTTRVIK
jgi:hypothetical protein